MNKKRRRLLFIYFAASALWAGEVPDSYRWLEDANSPRVQAWVKEQNGKAQTYFGGFPPQEKVTARLKQLYYADSVSLPKEAGGRLFYKRTRKDRDQPLYYWSDARRLGDERLWLDPAISGAHSAVGDWTPSPDGEFVAYALHPGGADEAVLHLRDAARNVDMPKDIIEGADFASVSWSADSRGFYYLHLPVRQAGLSADPAIPPAERVAHADIRFHPVGTAPGSDLLIYPPTRDASRYLSPQVSEDGQWLFIEDTRGWASNDIFYSRSVTSRAAPVFHPLFTSSTSVTSVVAWKDHFYLLTNQNASNGKILRRKPQEADWETVIPERSDAVIESLHVVGGYLVLVTLRNAADQVEIYRPGGQLFWQIPLPEPGQVWGVSGREDPDDLYIEFESFFVPTCIIHARLSEKKTDIWETPDIPVDAARYKTELAWYTSKDGTKVSMMIVHRKNLTKDGMAPLLLEGYGGFNTPILPRFSEEVLAWLEMGGVYAVPHLRGGGEYGEAWHRAGMLSRKQNTFDDFIGAAEFLVKEGYTRPDRMAIQGASNGGLLVAAVLTQRPDLFRAAICKNPLTDMLRYTLFGEGMAWVSEYGSPQKDDEFRTLYAYSPYHHVHAAAYPSILMFAGEHDDRVDPMHARKFTAAIQSANLSGHPVLFRLLKDSGHSGSDHLAAQVQETTERLTFLSHELGMDPRR